MMNSKQVPPEKLTETVAAIRKSGRTIATLNGSFDLLHAGHLKIIHEAKKQADCLIMALNTDRSIQDYKSPDRPLIALEHRLEMVAALEAVDYVTWFDETDPCKLLSVIQPDVHINGSEYGKDCIEADTVRKYGGKIHIVSLVPGLSTSQIIKKIQSLS
ncbi:adenylyltransferase/cytidyltransferase family protein [Simkania sp.]|uniref:adenylyltransferase/cytidyltransferase family protein n=1 Tax=Simkania sp. TaxID=34094 RepID=UPI003B51F0CD